MQHRVATTLINPHANHMHAHVYIQMNSVVHHRDVFVTISTLVNHSQAIFFLMTCLAAVVTPDTSSIMLACIALRAVCLKVPWLLAQMASFHTLVVQVCFLSALSSVAELAALLAATLV